MARLIDAPRRLVQARGRTGACFAVLLLTFGAPACGGGGDEPTQGDGGRSPTQVSPSPGQQRKATPEAAEHPAAGKVIRRFEATLVGTERIVMKAQLTRPTHVSLEVIRLVQPDPVVVGGVRFGRKQGRVEISWNLRVRGRKLSPGRYRLTLLGGSGAGRSAPLVITIPA